MISSRYAVFTSVGRDKRERSETPRLPWIQIGCGDAQTSSAFPGCVRSWNACAGRLRVRVNKVRRRIRAVEGFTGRDLPAAADRASLSLTLRESRPSCYSGYSQSAVVSKSRAEEDWVVPCRGADESALAVVA
ncbi:helix-turn-helix domain-containing protein [Streptosporangium sp. NPDC000396]|uniref:helix-turn-helix domain-containing protein n=1 Tax=Streptosporangium sp. NPDC000396 TaxID=3366185 RepID=UPI0036CE9AB8